MSTYLPPPRDRREFYYKYIRYTDGYETEIAGFPAGVYDARDTAVVRLTARQNFRVRSAKGGVVVIHKVPPPPPPLAPTHTAYHIYIHIRVLIYLLYT